ncbi:hypothetical protein CDAR_378981 [Caerostris darwini]|uniref:Uncharacterized protein n=1 Tax=Caerostris darwini TaxID=1538125 RepID=A0AAV4TYW9_9ARAC|nr:hypothetical protein CDAR_378981 [Caerostris darwini]
MQVICPVSSVALPTCQSFAYPITAAGCLSLPRDLVPQPNHAAAAGFVICTLLPQKPLPNRSRLWQGAETGCFSPIRWGCLFPPGPDRENNFTPAKQDRNDAPLRNFLASVLRQRSLSFVGMENSAIHCEGGSCNIL